MRLYVGPVAPDSVVAWVEWARGVLDDLRNDPRTSAWLCTALDDIEAYVGEWERGTGGSDGAFRWQSEVPAEDLEYLTNALYNLDLHLAADGEPGGRVALAGEGRDFHLVLVQALLAALSHESPTHAAFVDQIRASWPTAAAAH
jgi:hypothetical protein